MRQFTCADVVKATGGKLISGNLDAIFTDIGTDSRQIKNGSLFVPIIGEKFDAHDFVKNSLETGAAGAIVSKLDGSLPNDKVIIEVDDTLIALGNLAKWYRSTFDVPVVAITGSVGKTSTKEMIHAILNKKFSTLKTQGNFNNAIGLPLSVFKMDNKYNAMVLEMGMSSLGEISWLSKIANPQIGIITNIGLSHIETLGSRQNILKAKLEVLDGMSPEGVLILNYDDPMLAGIRDFVDRKVITFGTEDGADVRAEGIFGKGEYGSEFTLSIHGELYEVKLSVPGSHNVYNALASIATGKVLGIPIPDMIEALRDFSSDDSMRMFIQDIAGVKVINDSYNASPASMKAALKVLQELDVSGKKVAVLGNILELGDWTEKAHREVGGYVAQNLLDALVAVGDFGNYTASGALDAGFDSERIFCFETNDEVNRFLKTYVTEGDALLIKGSRGAKMEQIFNFLKKEAE